VNLPEFALDGRTFTQFATLSSEQSTVFAFCRLLEKEFAFRTERGLNSDRLTSYYDHMFTRDGVLIPITVLGYSARLVPAIRVLRSTPGRARILNAGCGYGTESILFSMFGSEVVGVDLRAQNIDLARTRMEFFQSIASGPLDVTFLNANVLRLLNRSGRFDMIWAKDAVSHICPPEEFLRLAYDKLNTKGKLVISDSNILSPPAWWRGAMIRGSFRRRPQTKYYNDPETGTPVEFGRERIFSVFGFQKALARDGFGIDKTYISGFMGTSWLPKRLLTCSGAFGLLSAFERMAANTPGLRFLGSLYTIVASKHN